MTAFTGISGQYRMLAAPQHSSRHQDTNAPASAVRPTAGAMLATRLVLTLVTTIAVLLATVCALAALLAHPSPAGQLLLTAFAAAMVVLAGQILVGAWVVQAGDRRQRASNAQMAEQIDRLRGALADVATVAREPGDPAKLDEQELTNDPRYLAGWADGLAGRRLGEGKVVPISGYSHHR